MSNTEVGKLLSSIGASLGRSPAAMDQFVQRIVVDGWYDSLESLENLSDDQWARFQLPHRLEELLKQKIHESRAQLPNLVPISSGQIVHTSPAAIAASSSVPPPPDKDQFKVDLAPSEIQNTLSIPVSVLIESIRDEIFSVVPDSPELMVKECVRLIARIVGNILSDVENVKYRRVKLDNPKFSQFVGRWVSANDLLKAIGFENDNDSIVCKTVYISRFTDVMESLAESVGDGSIVVPNSFNPFKSSITNAGDTFGVPRGRLAEERNAELDAVKSEVDQLRSELGKATGTGRPLEPPRLVGLDTKFEATSSSTDQANEDTSLLLANMKSIAAAGESAQKFKSREKLELEKLRTRKQFTKTTIRILFADKFALEIIVSVGETIEGIYGIVASCLNEPMRRSTEWVLTVSPPLKRLSRTSKATMLQEEFVPSIVMRMMRDGNLCVSTHVLSNSYISQK